MSHQPTVTNSHSKATSKSRSNLKPAASEDSTTSVLQRVPFKTQAAAFNTPAEKPTMAGDSQQRQTLPQISGARNGNGINDVSSARPDITVTQASGSNPNGEGGGGRGTASGKHLAPSARQGSPSNRHNARAASQEYRHSERLGPSGSRYQPQTQEPRPSIRQVATSESFRKKEASYYAEPEQQQSNRAESSSYGQTAARESRSPLVPPSHEAPVGRSRRYSPIRTPEKSPSRSHSNSPPLEEKLPVFHKPISVLPPSGPEPDDSATLSSRQADTICDELVKKVKVVQLGKMYDRAMEADRRGLMDDVLYDQVLDFFHRFLPMVLAAADSDPIIINRRQILDHDKVWKIFGPNGEGLSRKDKGRNRPHPWYTRPKDKKLTLKEVVGEAMGNIPRVQIIPGPAKRNKEQERR